VRKFLSLQNFKDKKYLFFLFFLLLTPIFFSITFPFFIKLISDSVPFANPKDLLEFYINNYQYNSYNPYLQIFSLSFLSSLFILIGLILYRYNILLYINTNKRFSLTLLFILFIIYFIYFLKISSLQNIFYSLLTICIIYTSWKKFESNYFALIICSIVAFYPFAPISETDLEFIFISSLQILGDFQINQIYNQYGFLHTFVGYLWLKTGLEVEKITYLLSTIILLDLIFFYHILKKIFKYETATLLIIIYIIYRFIVNISSNYITVQTTPIRFELWLILIFLVIQYGLYTKRNILLLLTLTILIFNESIYYNLAFISTIFTVSFFKNNNVKDGIRQLLSYRILILVVGILLTYKLIGDIQFQHTNDFIKYGVAFNEISSQSKFWTILPLITISVLVLLKNRDKNENKIYQIYLFTFFLLFFHMLYFYNRAHDNNLLNIFSIFITHFSLMFYFIFYDSENKELKIKSFFIILLMISLVSSDKIVNKIKNRISQAPQYSEVPSIDKGKNIFISRTSYKYYIKNQTTPVGFVGWIEGHIIEDKYIQHLHILLKDNYKIYFDKKYYLRYKGLIKKLSKNNLVNENNYFIVISNND